MQLADWLDDFVEEFVHHIADVSFERLVFLADRFFHPVR